MTFALPCFKHACECVALKEYIGGKSILYVWLLCLDLVETVVMMVLVVAMWVCLSVCVCDG